MYTKAIPRKRTIRVKKNDGDDDDNHVSGSNSIMGKRVVVDESEEGNFKGDVLVRVDDDNRGIHPQDGWMFLEALLVGQGVLGANPSTLRPRQKR